MKHCHLRPLSPALAQFRILCLCRCPQLCPNIWIVIDLAMVLALVWFGVKSQISVESKRDLKSAYGSVNSM